MPTKIKITKEMLVNAAFDIVREEGFERLSTRVLAEKLGVQPSQYFQTFLTLKSCVK